jgi:hypothetical protein
MLNRRRKSRAFPATLAYILSEQRFNILNSALP